MTATFILVPADAGLQRLLRAGMPRYGKLGPFIGALANAAGTDGYPQRNVELSPDIARETGFALAALLRQARQDGDPAAGALAGFLAAQFGAAEDD